MLKGLLGLKLIHFARWVIIRREDWPDLGQGKQNLQNDNLTAAPASWSSEILNNPNIMMIGTTYDLEQVNGLAYLQQQGLIKDGDTIGHIYIDGEYGGNTVDHNRIGTNRFGRPNADGTSLGKQEIAAALRHAENERFPKAS